jgi:hypothetical protein
MNRENIHEPMLLDFLERNAVNRSALIMSIDSPLAFRPNLSLRGDFIESHVGWLGCFLSEVLMQN